MGCDCHTRERVAFTFYLFFFPLFVKQFSSSPVHGVSDLNSSSVLLFLHKAGNGAAQRASNQTQTRANTNNGELLDAFDRPRSYRSRLRSQSSVFFFSLAFELTFFFFQYSSLLCGYCRNPQKRSYVKLGEKNSNHLLSVPL